ncbi:MAG: hypothetical protein IJA89_06875 [Clostridia bacterium]|nr:hypothetical protein [Clostridia bacterium]
MEKKKELEKVPVTAGVLASLVEFCKRRDMLFLSSYDNFVHGAKQEVGRLLRVERYRPDKDVDVMRYRKRLCDYIKENRGEMDISQDVILGRIGESQDVIAGRINTLDFLYSYMEEKRENGAKTVSSDDIIKALNGKYSQLHKNFIYFSDFYRGQFVAQDYMLGQLRYLVDECCYTQENCKSLFEKQLAHYTGGECEGFDNGYKQAYKEIIDFLNTGLKVCVPVGCEL